MNIVKIRIFSFHLQKSGNIDKFKSKLIFKFRNLLNWKMYNIHVSRFEVKRRKWFAQEPRLSATALPLPPLQERMRDGIAATFSLIHETVSQFSSRMAAEMKRYNYVTPVNFLELVAGYKM